MYLKHLALEGFKSFPEWNGLELVPGTCVLVGGNGTGKSNLADAVCWVLGQTDTSSLRVTGPAELVFAGSEDLLPMAEGEVTAVLDRRPQREGGPALPGSMGKHAHAATHEREIPDGLLVVTRRVSASGDDSYFLDGRPADEDSVREALRDCGFGFPPVTVIRQGELERLLLLDPSERRRAIEEAAGIPHLTERRYGLAAERELLLLRREHVSGESAQNQRQAELLRHESAGLLAAEEEERSIAALRSAAVAAAFKAKGGDADLASLLDILGLPEAAQTELTWAEIGHRIEAHRRRLSDLGPLNTRAPEHLEATRAQQAALDGELSGLDEDLLHLDRAIIEVEEEASAAFAAALERIEARFASYYGLLAPEGEATLTLTETGVDLVVRPAGKVICRVSALSGGERSLAALSLALALFQEYASPLFVLDEVEPALDDTNIRRLQAVLDRVADSHQILMISHQQRAKEAGDAVFGIERNLDGASQVKFRYEPKSRRLDVFRRTRTAPHLRRHPDQPAMAPAAAGARSETAVRGLAGSPAQAALMEAAMEVAAGQGGPGAGRNRYRRVDYFQEDGTFRGIWEVYRDEDEAAAEPTGGEEPASKVPSPKDAGGSGKSCC